MRFILVIFLILLFPMASVAQIADGQVCLYTTSQIEKREGIKENLLSTIAMVESGRGMQKNNLGYAWPWTIAYDGKGEYLPSKKAAIARVKELQQKGHRSIDVGCMQINLYHHAQAFKTLDEAFSPEHNISYAADFVKRLYNKHGTWGAAATAYHSHDEQKAYMYESKLISTWSNIKKHLAQGGKLHTIEDSANKQIALADNIRNEILDKQEAKLRAVDRGANSISGSFAAVPVKMYQMEDSSSFASSWRAEKLAEYMARKDSRVYRSSLPHSQIDGSF